MCCDALKQKAKLTTRNIYNIYKEKPVTYEELVQYAERLSVPMRNPDGRRMLYLPSRGDDCFAIIFFPGKGIALYKLSLDEVLPPKGRMKIVRRTEWVGIKEEVLTKLPEIGFPLDRLEVAFERMLRQSQTRFITGVETPL
jgi:hypothetical protein